MIYLQLNENYKDFDKLRIKDIHFTQGVDKRLSFIYQVYKKDGSNIIELFSKTLIITDIAIINQFETYSNPGLSMWDEICTQLIQYIITLGIESGTVEAE